MRTLLTAVIGAVVCLTGQASSPQSSNDSARAWFLERQDEAYEAVMPLAVPDRIVAYRFVHETQPDMHERYFSIQHIRVEGRTFRALISATVVAPVGNSIQRQLRTLRAKDGAASMADTLSRVTLRKETVDVEHCRAIADQLDGFSGVSMSMPSRDIFMLDADVRRIAVNMGNIRMTAEIQGGQSQLVAWADRTHELLLGCLSKR
jgi:hypothetical protein